jgi:predicted acetyltransferase
MASSGGGVDIRLIRSDEIGAFARSMSVPFLWPMATDADRERWLRELQVEIGRSWAVDDRGHFVGNAGILSRRVTLPAGPDGLCPEVAMTAVTAVGVHPTHRRRGILRRLMGLMLDDGRAKGEVVAGLTASESSIYGRYGFGWAVTGSRAVIAADRSAFSVAAPSLDIELLFGDEATKVVPALFDRVSRRYAGQVNRDDETWAYLLADHTDERDGASATLYAACDQGVASWRAKRIDDRDDVEGVRLFVHDLIGETAEVEAALWRFALDTDLVREVVAFPRPMDEPLRHRLVDPRQLRTTRLSDVLWLRILDTPGALTARGYLRAGRLVVDVRAPASTPTGADGIDGPDPAAGRWTLEAGPDGSTCRPAAAGESSDLTLGVAELSTLLAGEIRASTLAAAGKVREHRSGALSDADALFVAGRTPLSLTGF